MAVLLADVVETNHGRVCLLESTGNASCCQIRVLRPIVRSIRSTHCGSAHIARRAPAEMPESPKPLIRFGNAMKRPYSLNGGKWAYKLEMDQPLDNDAYGALDEG